MRTNDIFGTNLRALMERSPESISETCRIIGVNRTQFHRFLDMASWPRPDVLQRICDHFGTDARILLQPLETIEAEASKRRQAA